MVNKLTFIEIKNPNNFVSLYDFLGKPAGNKLGEKVHNFSKFLKIPIQMRNVNTITYKGKVCLYPKEFLEFYFKLDMDLKSIKRYFDV